MMEEHLQQIKEEVEQIKPIGWNSLYQRIRTESSSHDFPCGEARSAANKQLNRYRDVSPYDHSRVVLNNGPCNYINASLVKMEKAGRNYILTQGPLPQTTGHFWLMVWQQNSKAIVMLNKIIEKNQIKCHQYWPVGSQNGGGDHDVMEFQDVGLKVRLLSENESFKHFIIRNLSIEEMSTGNSREVLQFHYVTWPDFGVPSTPRAFLHFLQEVRDSGALDPDVGPPVVHCSAGIGRSGTFCLVDTCLLMMDQGHKVNVKDILLEMRRYRMGLIQTADQLQFSYLAIQEGLQQMVDGKTQFIPDFDATARIEECKPKPPMRLGSLNPPSTDELIRCLQLHLVDGIPGSRNIVDKPLPEPPSSSSSSEEEDDDDILDESDSYDDSDFEENGSVEEPSISEPTTKDSVDVESEASPATEESQVEKVEDANNGHAKPNGVDESTLRKRLKNEATLNKIREIKQRQKEQEMKAELYQRVYRSLTGKKSLLCLLGFSMVAMYLYSKL